MKRKLSRSLAAIIMVMMIFSLIAGCGTTKDTGTTASSGEKTAVSEQPVQKDTSKDLKEVTLMFYFGGEKKPAVDEVWNTLSEKYKDKLNAKYEINFIPFNDYTDKLMVMSSSGDDYDMNFDGNWLSYAKMINKGAYLPLSFRLKNNQNSNYRNQRDIKSL